MSEKTVLVTGAADGIGRAIAISSARRGWSVSVLDIKGSRAAAVAEEALEAGAPLAIGVQCDVTSEKDLAAGFAATIAQLGVPQGVVANAGIEINGPVATFSLDDWRKVLDTNLTGVFLTVREAINTLEVAGIPGSIVCTSSPSAFVGFAGGGNAAYGASKGGIVSFVRSAAIDYAKHGIRINALIPGATDTAILTSGLDAEAKVLRELEIIRDAAEQIPVGRLALPEEIAAAATWLLGDESSYVTGSSLVCDGGLLAKSANTF